MLITQFERAARFLGLRAADPDNRGLADGLATPALKPASVLGGNCGDCSGEPCDGESGFRAEKGYAASSTSIALANPAQASARTRLRNVSDAHSCGDHGRRRVHEFTPERAARVSEEHRHQDDDAQRGVPGVAMAASRLAQAALIWVVTTPAQALCSRPGAPNVQLYGCR
jgi:hypothetical protein